MSGMAEVLKRRRWLSFSLRGLMIVVTILCVWLGWWVNSAVEQRAAVEAIHRVDEHANLWYDNENLDSNAGMMAGWGGVMKRSSSWAPDFIEQRLGKDFFHNVKSVAFGQGLRDAARTAREVDLFRKVSRLARLDQLVPYFPVSDADVAHLSGLPRLTRLDLAVACPELSDAALDSISRMQSLESLTIASAPITDAGLAHLGRMTQLKSLVLGNVDPHSASQNKAQITDAGLAHLAALINLSELELDSRELTGRGLAHLSGMDKLKWLRLNSPGLVDDDLAHLAPLKSLELLELFDTSVRGGGFEHLVGLTNLRTLIVAGPSISDDAIAWLARLPNLEGITLYRTSVTAAGLEQFNSAPRLRTIGLRPAVKGDTQRLKQALPNIGVLNGGKTL
jgi:hypothetical protein